MGSRLRENPSRLIECWCEIVAPQDVDHPAWIIQKFPRTYEEAEVLKSIPQFTFPCPFEKYAVQHFSFVLTNLESKFLYGFCRHAPDSQTAIVILSHLPWHELFYKILNHCSTLMSSKNCGDLWSFLQCLYQTSVPSPGTKFTIDYSEDKFFVAECPNHISLPSIPENRNLSEYYNAVDVKNMMLIFASMLNERRIIVTSERVSRLSACVQAANSLIYPMSWQHIFIPVLPQHLLDYLNAPMPFLIGVSWNLMLKVRREELGDVVILNADTNEVDTPFADLQNLPEEVVSSLKKNLNPTNNLIGDSVARAFLKAIVQLIGNYREALQFRESDKKITFNTEKFVIQRPPHFQPFVRKMLELQIFSQFIEERLELLNSGLHTSDEFELEISVYGEKSSSKVKQLFSNVRKESGAIMKNVKSKTNPAMKSAVKSVSKGGKNVREKSLNTYKEIRGKFKDIQQKNSENGPYANGLKPRSAPSSPTYPVKRPMKSISGVYEGYTARTTYKRSSQPSPGSNSANSSMSSKNLNNNNKYQGDSQKTPSPQEIDLLGEMQDVLGSQLGLSSTASMSITETASNSSLNSSILSSEASNNLFSSETYFNYPKDIHPSDSLHNDNERVMPPEGSKPINASYTSLPLLDLSLDIPLPPPLFPPSAAFPKKHSSVAEGVSSSTRSRHSSFRSPKIFPPETFGSLPSSLEDTTVNFTSSPAFGGGSNVGLYSRPKAYTLPVEGGERQVGRIPSEVVVPRRHHFINIPKYDVNPSFSESLAKFSTKENFSSYFYSSLAKPCSKSSNSVFDMQNEATELSIKPIVYSQKTNSSNIYHNNNRTIAASTPLSPPDILRDPSPNPSTIAWDIMTMSLPLDIKSISDISTNNPSSFSHPQHPSRPSPSHSSSATRKTAAVISSHPTLLTPPPRYHRRRKKATIPAEENDSSQDILLMDSPKEEEFDPLLSKEIPPPIPSRKSLTATQSLLNTSLTKGYSDQNIESQFRKNNTNNNCVNEIPGKLKADRFLPFSSLQATPTRVVAQNPSYNLHQPPFTTNKSASNPNTLASNNSNPAALFAASLLVSDQDTASFKDKGKTSSLVRNSPFINSEAKEVNKTAPEQDLLGDFSADFKKLSFTTRGTMSTSP